MSQNFYNTIKFCLPTTTAIVNYLQFNEIVAFLGMIGNINRCKSFVQLVWTKIFHVGSPDESNAGKYIGCYKDQAYPRHLGGFSQDFRNGLTVLKCTGLCYSMGFLYSATQNR